MGQPKHVLTHFNFYNFRRSLYAYPILITLTFNLYLSGMQINSLTNRGQG
ncbi:hypothetical protein HanPSC8_Chr01g0002231 [Helianthus annuus]|nr:hypothetical protein HanPSC8_Chr01g0002231 [Helianthus annuus]